MNLKNIKPNVFTFISSYILFILVFLFISYKFIITDFIKLEETQNHNNVNFILNSIHTNMINIKNITNDYSKWDDTYDFIITLNKNYIYENFREGTTTLEDLDIDFIIFSNNEQKVLFSKYENSSLKKDRQNFEKNILTKFKRTQKLNTIIKYNSYYLYLIKSEILKSDETGDVNGWIYSGKIITNDALKKISKAFDTIKISQTAPMNYSSKVSLQYFGDIKINTRLTYQDLINTMQFYNNKNEYIFSIITKNERKLVNNGEKTIFIFNIIVAFSIFAICFFIYKNQIILSKYNRLLELKVNRRTNQLTKTLRKLKTKNKELYTLANIDSLTKIRNRRSYFIESESLLKKSISGNKTFCILMIDIDYFKKINDTYGHSAGDKVLIEFCTIINSVIEDEVFGRIGGEEFCITFFNKEMKDINLISENIRKKCEETIICIDDKDINFTISLGLSCKENFTNIDEILQVSDELLYKAKEEGRNRLIRSALH